MSDTLRSSCRLLLASVFVALLPAIASAQGRPTALAATRADAGALRATDDLVESLVRSRALRSRASESDPLVADRRHERFDQYHRGVRIVGGDVTRQTGGDGTVSVFGMLHSGVDIGVDPALPADRARDAIAGAVDGRWFAGDPELVVLPLSDGYHLAYAGRAIAGLEVVNVYVDANSGALLQQYSDFTRDIGTGKGAYGDDRKVSARPASGTFLADDPLRPAAITTYDMKGSLARTTAILNRQVNVTTSDIGADSDNVWTDSTVVDAHVYAGWYYDYLFKRFGRRGLDGNNLRMAIVTHPVRLEDIASAPIDVLGLFYVNAFFCAACGPDGRGAVTFGEGAPRNFLGAGVEVKPFSASFDVVAHELTHGVTAASSRLNGFPYSEAGALNEAFSDIFGASASFFQLPAGTTPVTASYLLGRDLTVPGGLLARSMSNPASTRDPDFYTQRNIGGDPHANGVIVTHAFYLAIEGGTNRTSGLSVAGVGASNRDQIEKAFFRALTVLMPSSSTFALTRQATIQSARDLFGAGSAAERAITQAWDAVGVQERTAPTAAVLPNPTPPSTASCGAGVANPHWVVGITVSAGSSSLQISQWTFDLSDHAGALQDHEVLSAGAFAAFFNQCGPGSSRLVAQSDACAAVCADLGGDTMGAVQVTVVAIDDAGRTVTFSTPRTVLAPR